MSESWVINASPLILLAKAGLLDRVPKLVENFVVPQPVVVEISSARNDAAALWINGAGQPFIHPPAVELPELTHVGVGAGERAVISWAVAHPGFVAVLDDREARNIARRLGVPILGTVGVVLRLKKAGLISEAKPHLLHIKQVGGYISAELLHEALRSVGEQL